MALLPLSFLATGWLWTAAFGPLGWSGQPISLSEEFLVPARLERPDAAASRMVAEARRLVGTRTLRRVTRGYTDDCSGLVRYLYGRQGTPLVQRSGDTGGSAVGLIFITARAQHSLHDSPEPGDLVFFHDTYDRNRDGRRNDGLTHVGLVERVDRSTGTVMFIHRSSKGVTRERMNLLEPHQHTDPDGRAVLNDYVRSLRGSAAWPRLAGELFAGFASARVLLHAEPLDTTPALERAASARQRPPPRRNRRDRGTHATD